MEKYLLFTTGDGSADPLNWDSGEASLYSVSDFKSIKPSSPRTLDLFFSSDKGTEIVTLNIDNGSHVRVMQAISSAIVNSSQSIVTIADVDNTRFVNKSIYGVSIKTGATLVTGTDHSKIALTHSPASITLCSVHASNAAVGSLWLTDITGKDISDTGVDANESDNAATTSSVTLTVDGTTATNTLLLDEKVFKSNGTLFGTCTAVSSGTEIVFANGLETTLANNDDLYTGNRYFILEDFTFPLGSTLKLEADDISFSMYQYSMFIQLSAGSLDLIARY